MRSGCPLFSLAIQNPPLAALSHVNGALGELPPDLKIVLFNEDGYLERDGCEIQWTCPAQLINHG